jgi:preprotein translocase subunit SecG
MFQFILILQTLVAIVMITVILMQRSEGGGLTGGSPSGLMTARGAADFLTRTTAITATLFVALSILLAAVAAGERAPRTIDPSLLKQPPASTPAQPQQPLIPGAQPQAPTQPPAEGNQTGVPLAQ